MMFFLSLHPHVCPSSSAYSYSCSLISSSLIQNNNNNYNNNSNHSHNHQQPTSLSIPKDPNNPNSEASIIKVKAPTPPWMKGPLLLQSHELLDLSKPTKRLNKRHVDESQRADKALIGKEVRGKKVLKRIAKRVERLQRTHNSDKTQMGSSVKVENFGGYLEKLDENDDEVKDEKVMSLMGSSAKGENFEGYLEKFDENDGDDDFDDDEVMRKRRMPWEKDEDVLFLRVRKEKVVTAAELCLDKVLLKRLRGDAEKMRIWVKVNKAGVTQDVVDEIRRTWRRNELAMVKFGIPLCRNMDRAREIVELKTGGLVVWSKKDTLVVYRGWNYRLIPRGSPKIYRGYNHNQRTNTYQKNVVESVTKGDLYSIKSNAGTSDMLGGNANNTDSILSDIQDIDCSRSLYERETDRLLDGLGPRFIDWWYYKPLPVDADLLPEVVSGLKPPFRLCPPHASEKLTDSELTYFRNLAKSLPTHFVLGRNRGLQGLAAAIVKLWEKSLIAKIAIKLGIPNTNNEMMANELKELTGGVLLLRNKFYIILYRGNDFLPSSVASLVEKRELELKSCQLYEEDARMRAIEAFSSNDEPPQETSTSGTLTEFKEIQTKLEDTTNVNADSNIQLEAEIYRLERQLKEQQRKAFILNKKIEKSAMELSELNAAWTSSDQETDLEILIDEERQCFRKIGLKMDASLVLGRRGVFDGVLEGIHQHWKHREVAKVITMQRLLRQVIYTAKMLEAESGGILVSVDKLKEGHAIIIYRGKNYKRPPRMIAKNLLTKRKALHRSLEIQRLGSLKFFAHQRQQTISELKLKLADLKQRKETEQREFEN